MSLISSLSHSRLSTTNRHAGCFARASFARRLLGRSAEGKHGLDVHLERCQACSSADIRVESFTRESMDLLEEELEVIGLDPRSHAWQHVNTCDRSQDGQDIPWPKFAIQPCLPPPKPSTISSTTFVIASLPPKSTPGSALP